MICQRCLTRLSGTSARSHVSRAANSSTSTSNLQLSSHRDFIRPFTRSSTYSATPVTAQTATSTNPRPNDAVSAATSTSAAQPFSTPTTPSPSNISDVPIKPDQTKQPAARAPSSVPAGTVLKGLNFLKTASDPVAKADEEYPPWLWTVLDSGASGREAQGENSSEGDLFSKSKKLRRRAAKALRRAALQNPEALAPKVPLQQQSVDLPAGDGTLAGALHAGDARARLTKAMRDQRRKKIKEDNFLREMR